MRTMMEDDQIHEDVIKKLWQVYSKRPSVTQRSISEVQTQALKSNFLGSSAEAP